jgi:hypothetical protein
MLSKGTTLQPKDFPLHFPPYFPLRWRSEIPAVPSNRAQSAPVTSLKKVMCFPQRVSKVAALTDDVGLGQGSSDWPEKPAQRIHAIPAGAVSR